MGKLQFNIILYYINLNILEQLLTQNRTQQIVKLFAKKKCPAFVCLSNFQIAKTTMTLFYRAYILNFIIDFIFFYGVMVWEPIFKEQQLPESNC